MKLLAVVCVGVYAVRYLYKQLLIILRISLSFCIHRISFWHQFYYFLNLSFWQQNRKLGGADGAVVILKILSHDEKRDK